jgi:hypothetical protein
VRKFVTVSTNENAIIHADLSPLTSVQEFVHMAGRFGYRRGTAFAESLRPNKYCMADYADRLIIKHIDYSSSYMSSRSRGVLPVSKNPKYLQPRIFLDPHQFCCPHWPSPLCAPRNSIANFSAISFICADFEIVVFVIGSVCIAASTAASSVARSSGETMNSKPRSR